MSKVLKKSQAIAILKASKSKPKALWNTDNNDKIVPLFTGGELIRTDVLGFHSVEKETPIDVIKAQISPALLGEKEIEEEKAEKATEEEKEQFRRSEIRAELEAKYSVQISELEAKIESVRVAAQSDGHIAGHQEGYEAGMNEGKDEGLKQGQIETERELHEELSAHAELAKELRTERDNILNSAKSDAIELAMRLTERLVGARLQNSEYLRSRLEQALEAVSDGIGDPIYVKVAPSQVDVFKAITQRNMSHENDLYIEPDPDIQAGDLVVESCGRRVSSVLKEQLERLEEVLYE